MPIDAEQFVKWFRSASPYIHVHRGKTFVIQFDDDAIRSETFTGLVHDLALLNSLGIQLVLVYATRHSIEHHLKEKHLSLDYHQGIRITDAQAMEIVKQEAGRLRVEIESRLSMGLGNTPMSNAELRVSSGNFVTAKPMGIVDGIDFQYTGETRRIDIESIKSKLDANEIVLIPPLGYSATGETFNLSAADLAIRLAVNLGADKLVYLMETEGITDAEGKLIREMDQRQAESLLQQRQGNEQESCRYIHAAINASEQGVQRVHLIDRRQDGAILQELFTRDGAGTMISSVPYDVIRKAAVDDIAGIIDLIEPLEKEGILVQRSREKLELEVDHFTLLERDAVIIGCAALYPLDNKDSAELACLAVHADYHNENRGRQLLSLMETEAKKTGIKKIFVLTTHAEHWFLEAGFVNAKPEDLPVERKTLYNYQRKSKVLMKSV